MDHPNIMDNIKSKLDKNYLFPGQLCLVTSKLNVAIIHRVASINSTSAQWKIMDYLNLEKGSVVKFLGSGKQFRLSKDLGPDLSLFEITDISSDKMTSLGDILAFTKKDRNFLTPSVNLPPKLTNDPTYFTAADA